MKNILKNLIKSYGVGLSVFFLPFIVFAQSRIDTFLENIKAEILRPLIALMVIVALIVFAWGIIEWIYGADNDKKVEQGKKHIIYSIIGFSIIFGVWAILNTICNLIGAC